MLHRFLLGLTSLNIVGALTICYVCSPRFLSKLHHIDIYMFLFSSLCIISALFSRYCFFRAVLFCFVPNIPFFAVVFYICCLDDIVFDILF